MIRARNLSLLCLVATLGLAVPVADAGQRRGDGQRTAQPRDGARRSDGAARRGASPARRPSGRAGSRPIVVGPRIVQQVGPRVVGPRGWRNYGYGYGLGYRRVPLPRAYYAFRPRLNVGLGLWAGFAVPFPRFGVVGGFGPYPYGYPMPSWGYPAAYAAPYPAPYPVPYPVPYAAPGVYGSAVPVPNPAAAPQPVVPPAAPSTGVEVLPAGAYGGVSLDITPADAEVWVDGGFAGRAGDFDASAQPLTLPVGAHRLELRAPGYQPLAFDVTVTPGYVVPFQGVLQPGA